LWERINIAIANAMEKGGDNDTVKIKTQEK
jgi:hypothetical protein